MKRILLATVAVAALSAPAAAADLAMKYPVKAVPAPVFSWTGFYIGANFGYGGGKTKFTDNAFDASGAYLGGQHTDVTGSGFFAGGQLGYNYQLVNNVVLGLETDLQWSDIKSEVKSWQNVTNTFEDSAGTKLEYFGTIRARVGYAFDRFLPYITGGAAYGRVKFQDNDTWSGSSVSETNNRWGWTIGGGVEYALTNNWTFKTEYLYVDLGKAKYDLVDVNTGDFGTFEYDNKFHTIKAGVNYKF